MTKINNDPCHRFYMIRRSGKSPSSWNHKKKSIPKINIIKNVFNKIIIILINDQKWTTKNSAIPKKYDII